MPVSVPLPRVMLGDVPVAGAISIDVVQVGCFAADRFELTLALGASAGIDAAFFAAPGLQTITIDVAAGGFGYANLITGQVDHARVDLGQNIVVLAGRDLSARLIDAQITETFANRTASQIAETLAQRFGLTANVTATTTPVGQYYELDHAHSGLAMNSRSGTAWNLLTRLAQNLGFVVSVTGTTLNFGPPDAAAPVVLTPASCISLCVELAKTIPVGLTAKSWNTRNKMVVSQSAGMAGAGPVIVRPNLTSVQAVDVAATHLAGLARHGTVLTAELAGETVLRPAMQIYLSGSDSPLDQIYQIDEVSRGIDARRGFVESIRAHALI